MKCLVVGGTGFLGGAITDALIADGHSVAVLSRGQKAIAVGAPLEVIQADRYENLDALKDRKFNWVFDTCAYSPDAVESLLAALGGDIDRYVLISSISAYGTFSEPYVDETAVVPDATAQDLELAAGLSPKDRTSAYAYGPSYGPLKRACEIKAKQIVGNRAAALRVGLLVGAGDYSDRLTWWIRRIDEAKGERLKVPAPAPENRSLQLIDVRDVAAFALNCANSGLSGVWNVTSEPLGFVDVLTAISNAGNSDVELVWITEDTIRDAEVVPWQDIPMMAPMLPDFRHFLEVSTKKARSAGLSCRPIEETIMPLLEWDRSRREIPLKGGMTPEQEALLLGHQPSN